MEHHKGVKVKIVNNDGQIELFEPRSFQELRRDFSKLSLYSYKVFDNILYQEVIRALVKIKALC